MKTEHNPENQLIDEVQELRYEVARLKEISKQQESDIIELKQRIRKYFNGRKQDVDAIYVIFDRKCEFVNQSFEDLFGYRKDEICQSDFDIMQLIAPECRQTVEKEFIGGIKGDYNIRSFEFKALVKDGRKIKCETSVIFIPYKWGIAIQGTIHNISILTNIYSIGKMGRKSRIAAGNIH